MTRSIAGNSPVANNACPESHYWFRFWLRVGWTVTCTRCGTTERAAS